MTTVADLMIRNPATLDPEAKLEEAWRIMHDQRLRHVPICKGDHLVGLVTQKDLLVSTQSGSVLSLPVAEVMVFNVRTISPETDLAIAAQTMLDHKISCLPVVDGDTLIGIITESDFLSLLVDMLRTK